MNGGIRTGSWSWRILWVRSCSDFLASHSVKWACMSEILVKIIIRFYSFCMVMSATELGRHTENKQLQDEVAADYLRSTGFTVAKFRAMFGLTTDQPITTLQITAFLQNQPEFKNSNRIPFALFHSIRERSISLTKN